MRTVIFFREEGWYPVEHVDLNPGTKRVEDIDGNVLWPKLAVVRKDNGRT